MRIVTAIISASVGLLLFGCDGEQAPAKLKQIEPRAAAISADRPVANPFPTANEVRLFVETGYAKDGKPVLSRATGRVLTPSQRSAFEKALYLTTPPTEMAACFIPHHFFRYYDKQGKQVGEVAVCFCCGGLRASGQGNFNADNGQILSVHYDELEHLIKSLGEPTNVLCD